MRDFARRIQAFWPHVDDRLKLKIHKMLHKNDLRINLPEVDSNQKDSG